MKYCYLHIIPLHIFSDCDKNIIVSFDFGIISFHNFQFLRWLKSFLNTSNYLNFFINFRKLSHPIIFINFLILINFCFTNLISAQKFTASTSYVPLIDYDINSNGLKVYDIHVKNLPTKINSKFGFEKLQLTINHDRISDIKVVLESPNGDEVWISNRHGRNGKNYTETVFCNTGFRGKISDGTPPFLGEFLPDGNLSIFNNGQNPNGVWKLKVYDLEPEVVGQFGSVILYFSNHPAIGIRSKCHINSPSNCACNLKHKKFIKSYCELLPDLTLIKEVTQKEIHEIPYSAKRGYGELRFGVSTFNKGLGPLELHGNNIWLCSQDTVSRLQVCQDGTYPRQQVFQYIFYKTKNKEINYRIRPAGFNAYDARPGHEHYHSDDYVNYELFFIDSTKKENKYKIACKGNKASFCIWDLSYCRDELNNCKDVDGNIYLIKDLPNYGFKGYNTCSDSVQGLSVGGVDYYGEGFEGQSIELPKGFRNGQYFLKITIDPLNLFEESDEFNNSFIIPVFINFQNS